MNGPIGRMAQRDDQDVEPAPFECQNLLSDKGLGQPRIAFENKGDTPAWGVQSQKHGSGPEARPRRDTSRPTAVEPFFRQAIDVRHAVEQTRDHRIRGRGLIWQSA